MLTQSIADKIHSKVAGLVGQPLSVTDVNGTILATSDPRVDESADIQAIPWAIGLAHDNSTIGYVVLSREMPNHQEIAPLIQSISELILHQSLLIERLPHQEERLDKFIYDLVTGSLTDFATISAEARLFDIDFELPRLALVVNVDDPVLTGEIRDISDRELRISRYKFGLNRGLNSYYTATTSNVVAYLGHNSFCILKELGEEDMTTSLERFKRSTGTLYGILKGEIKQPITIGVGNYHPGIEGLRQSYDEALSAIELGSQNWDDNRVYHIDDFGVVAPLLSGVDESNSYFSRELLDKLSTHEHVNETLESFFSNNMALTQTANELGIHRNTLVYRLERITEALDLDPRVFEDAVQIKLAMLFARFVEQNQK
ncbi:hypothetical protein EPO04_02620 [Patescibacteria group bacterium]|nr:MAG: hypothetical protein EPO04_02620 [Patescibacteria group bacterium]